MKAGPTASPTLAASGIRAFEAIADRWSWTIEERRRVLGMTRSTYHRARSNPDGARLGAGELERISHMLGIYKALHVLFSDPAIADSWLDRPNRAFGGQPARARVTTGQFSDLVDVRRYLDAQRGW